MPAWSPPSSGRITWDQRRRRLKHSFGPLAGTYQSARKLTNEPERGTVSITVKGNILGVRFGNLAEGESVTGEIAMNEQLPRSGRGHYWHLEGGLQMWGFWDVQAVDADTLLVHTTYANHLQPVAVVSGYVWSRKKPVV